MWGTDMAVEGPNFSLSGPTPVNPQNPLASTQAPLAGRQTSPGGPQTSLADLLTDRQMFILLVTCTALLCFAV